MRSQTPMSVTGSSAHVSARLRGVALRAHNAFPLRTLAWLANKKRPSGGAPEGAFPLVPACDLSRLTTGLLGSPRAHEFARINNRQVRGLLAALKIERLIVGTVDMNYLTRIQCHPKPRRRTSTNVGVIPYHDVHAAVVAAGLVEGDDALTANRREDGFVRTDRSKVLCKLLGVGRGTCCCEGKGRNRAQAPFPYERIHCKSPSRLGAGPS